MVMIPRPSARRAAKPIPVDVLRPPHDDAGWSQIRSSEEAGEPVAAPAGMRDDVSSAGAAPHPANGTGREQMIREAAYLRYQARGCEDGHALDDWLAAEAEIVALFPADAANPVFEPERPDDGVLP
jgi:hypothetical protein